MTNTIALYSSLVDLVKMILPEEYQVSIHSVCRVTTRRIKVDDFFLVFLVTGSCGRACAIPV